jgi:hypothetical protein
MQDRRKIPPFSQSENEVSRNNGFGNLWTGHRALPLHATSRLNGAVSAARLVNLIEDQLKNLDTSQMAHGRKGMRNKTKKRISSPKSHFTCRREMFDSAIFRRNTLINIATVPNTPNSRPPSEI